MNITPNATLVVQMIHFGLAYQVIMRLLCKPVLRELVDDQQVLDGLQDTIRTTNEIIDRVTRQRYEQSLDVHRFFIKNQPQPTCDIPMEIDTMQIHYPSATSQEIVAIVAHISTELVRKVMHDIE
jgi:hypothetical protein